jgi:molecular chaperone GrpE
MYTPDMPDEDEFDALGAAAELDAALEQGRSSAELEADLVALGARLAATERELVAAEARAAIAHAEIDGAKQRLSREAALERSRADRAILLEVIDVIDDLERALEAARRAGDGSALLQGIEHVYRKLMGVLAARGVAPIAAAGAPFDPAEHEAISVTAPADPAQNGTVVAVVRTGYRQGAELVRPAAVVVAKGG